MMQFETKQQMMKISTTILHARPLIPHLTTTNSINELNRMLTNNPICLKNSSRIVKKAALGMLNELSTGVSTFRYMTKLCGTER